MTTALPSTAQPATNLKKRCNFDSPPQAPAHLVRIGPPRVTATRHGADLLMRRRSRPIPGAAAATATINNRGDSHPTGPYGASPERALENVWLIHYNTGESPMSVKFIAYNRDPSSGRIRFTIRVRFEHQTWLIYKYYTDFLRLRNALIGSQFFEVAQNLPPKHPLSLRLRMKFSFSKKFSLRKEVEFLHYRMKRLELWLKKVLCVAGPAGVQHVRFLNDFFEAFPDDEAWHDDNPRSTNVEVDRSMYHGLRSMAVPPEVYERLWSTGYCFESLGSMSVPQWTQFGVSPFLAASLFARFHSDTRSTAVVSSAMSDPREMRPRSFSSIAAIATAESAIATAAISNSWPPSALQITSTPTHLLPPPAYSPHLDEGRKPQEKVPTPTPSAPPCPTKSCDSTNEYDLSCQRRISYSNIGHRSDGQQRRNSRVSS